MPRGLTEQEYNKHKKIPAQAVENCETELQKDFDDYKFRELYIYAVNYYETICDSEEFKKLPLFTKKGTISLQIQNECSI